MSAIDVINKKSARKQARSHRPRPVIGRTTLLILSGVLIGMALENWGRFPYGLAGGIVGILAYGLLEYLDRKRTLPAIQRSADLAERELEQKIRRHIPRAPHLPKGSQRQGLHGLAGQYVTVVNSRRNW